MIPFVWSDQPITNGCGEWNSPDGDGNGMGPMGISIYWLFYFEQNKRLARDAVHPLLGIVPTAYFDNNYLFTFGS